MDNDSMSMGSNGSTVPSTSKRRVWSNAEEKLLVIALKEIITEGWKCENGFRSGYLVYLEKKMRKHNPRTNLKAEPHISSKIHTWKKIQGSLNAMLSRSGFSWSHEAMKLNVECEDVWNEYLKVDKYAKRLRNKSFPMLNDWNEIFGKDRATGAQAEDLNGADTATNGADSEKGTEGGTEVGSDAEEITSPGPKLPTPNVDSGSKGKNGSASKKKRKLNIDETGESMVNLMGKFCEQTNERLSEIASKIGYEFVMSSKREKLFEAVSSLCVLSPEDVICVTRQLANNNKDLDLFFTLPEAERGRMVLCMVAGEK